MPPTPFYGIFIENQNNFYHKDTKDSKLGSKKWQEIWWRGSGTSFDLSQAAIATPFRRFSGAWPTMIGGAAASNLFYQYYSRRVCFKPSCPLCLWGDIPTDLTSKRSGRYLRRFVFIPQIHETRNGFVTASICLSRFAFL